MSGRKEHLTETSSLSTFGNNTEHSETTKKGISTEEISMESMHSELDRQTSHFHIVLAFQINIKELIKHIRLNFQEKGVNVLYSDQQTGQILVQRQPKRGLISCILDCCCLCRKQGWPKGSMFQTCEAVSLTIKREYIDQKCMLGVKANFPRNKGSKNLNSFVQDIMEWTKKLLDSYKDEPERHQILEINSQSPLAMQITAYKKIHQMFVEGVEDKRFKTLYDTSMEKLANQIAYMEKQEDLKKLRVADIIDKLIKEVDSLFEFAMLAGKPIIQGTHHEYILYAIQNLVCYNYFGKIFELYRKGMVRNCEEFRNNSDYINKKITNKQYFDYLQVRPKFRLPSCDQPYDLAIHALRDLETSLTLREVLLAVQKTFSLIKVCCLYEHGGKLQISSMDDVLPVMIFVVAKAQVQNFPVFVKIIDDYVRIRGVFELQQRITTTLYVATEDISKKLPQIPQ